MEATTTTTTSLLCTSTKLPTYRLFTSPFSSPSLSLPKLPLKPLQIDLRALPPLRSTATEEIVETVNNEVGFIEVGNLSSVHGLHGEICVKPSTDFPLLRFSKPGTRWLKQAVLGKERIQEVQLVQGSGHYGQKTWILKFRGIDTVDQAKKLVGSTLLVKENDRPELEEGEFYTRDLIGMRVILQETGEHVGTVVNVFNSGASDLLQVMLVRSSVDVPIGTETPNQEDGGTGPLVWIPFVEAIVPNVDMDKREMHITPPKGLLELNVRSDEISKKERRHLEWKERKKFQRCLIAAKKRLCELEQKHVFDGLRHGEQSQRSFLADQIVSLNSKLLRQALENIQMPPKRWDVTELISSMRTNLAGNYVKISEKGFTSHGSEKKSGVDTLREKGLKLLSSGKTAIALVADATGEMEHNDNANLVNSEDGELQPYSFLRRSFAEKLEVLRKQNFTSVPLVLVCPSPAIQSIKSLFADNDYFAFDPDKVWVLEEKKLPVVRCIAEEQNKYKILMKSPWEVLHSPVGSGGVLSLLSTHEIPARLSETGVEYIEICSIGQQYPAGNPLLLALTSSRKADIGFQIDQTRQDLEADYDMIFSIDCMKRLTSEVDKLQFHGVPKLNAFVELVDKEWVDVTPSSPNSFEIRSSIYSCLNACSLDNICMLEQELTA